MSRPAPTSAAMADHELLQRARSAIAEHLGGSGTASATPAASSPHAVPAATTASPGRASTAEAAEPHGVFVTLWSPDASGRHHLRGCIGRLERACASLADEVAQCAVSSATQDPRFPPVTPDELPRLLIEISLLGARERIAGASELNPGVYGVIVRSGWRHATLLPGIEGIETPEEQLRAVLRKAGIRPDEPIELWRFPARKITEW